MKICNFCQRPLSFENYSINKSTKDGYSNRCKECLSKTRKKETSKIEITKDSLEDKECKNCREFYSIEYFGRSKNTSDGRENVCKACRSLQRKKNAINGIFSVKVSKGCSKCKEILNIESFSKDRSRDDGYSAICKVCKNNTYIEYSQKLESKISARNRSAKWKTENPDKIKDYYIKNRERIINKTSEYHKEYKGKYTLFISQAKYRGIDCSISLDEYNKIISQNCYYCNSPKDIGIDRLDSNLGYEITNIVPACLICNYGKNTLSKLEFISHVRMIDKYQKLKIIQDGYPVVKYTGDPKMDHYLTPFGQYNRYKNSAKERRISFKLEYKEFVEYWQKPCSYCGSIISLIGLDRINNNEGYSIKNINSCCTKCNNLKRTLTLQEFLNHVSKICLHNE